MDTPRRLQLRDGHVGLVSATRIAALITWCNNPTADVDDIERILNDLSDDDVTHIMLWHDGPAKRIAWLEYGRRAGLAEFEVGLSVTDKEIALTYAGEGLGIHGLALYVEHSDD